MSFYKLEELQEVPNLTSEYECVREVPVESPFSRYTISAVSPHGSIFITNAATAEGKYDTDFWQYKFDENRAKKRAALPTPRKSHSMVFLNNFVYLIGGANSDSKALRSVDKYNVRKKVWTSANSLHVGVTSPTVCAFRNRYILSCCGVNEFDFISNRIELYDSANDAWSVVRTALNPQLKNVELLNGGSAVAINSDVIYIFGGKRNTGFQHDVDFALFVTDLVEIKKSPSRVSAELVPTGGEKRKALSFAGSFKANSGVVHGGSIYYLRSDIL